MCCCCRGSVAVARTFFSAANCVCVCVCVFCLAHLLECCVPRLPRWCRGCAAAAARLPCRRRSGGCQPWPGEAHARHSGSRSSAGSPGPPPSLTTGSRAHSDPAQRKHNAGLLEKLNNPAVHPPHNYHLTNTHTKRHTNMYKHRHSLNYCSLFS